jgi:hypothetical protein
MNPLFARIQSSVGNFQEICGRLTGSWYLARAFIEQEYNISNSI